MHSQSFLIAAVVLIVGALGAVTPRSYKAPTYQAASDLQNVSTYHALTRVKPSSGQLSKKRSYDQVSGRALGYGLTPTTSFYNVCDGRPTYHYFTTDILRLRASTLPSKSVPRLSTY
jgi:hypothetical protein